MEKLTITESIKTHMMSVAKWTKFFTGFATFGSCLLLLAGVFLLTIPEVEGIPGVALSFIYFAVVALTIYPIKKGFAVVKNTRVSMTEDDQEALETAAEDTHKLLRFCGITFIVTLVIYTIFVIGLIFVLAFSAYD